MQRTAENFLRIMQRYADRGDMSLILSDMNQTIRSALSFEYFIYKVEYITAMGNFGIRSSDVLRQDFKRLEGDLEGCLSKDEQLEWLRFACDRRSWMTNWEEAA